MYWKERSLHDTFLNTILKDLEEEDYNTAIQFIQFLADTRKKKKAINNKKILAEIQDIFQDDKGWENEEAMIKDLATFRKERMGLWK